MSRTKIVVLKRKQLMFTGILAFLLVLLILVLCFAFRSDGGGEDVIPTGEAKYIPGVYNSVIYLSDNALNLELVLDKNHINSVRIVNIDESVATMYPLIEPALSSLEEQLINEVALDSVNLSDDSKYTQTMLLKAIGGMLAKAEIKE